jgi:hypothetical protein
MPLESLLKQQDHRPLAEHSWEFLLHFDEHVMSWEVGRRAIPATAISPSLAKSGSFQSIELGGKILIPSLDSFVCRARCFLLRRERLTEMVFVGTVLCRLCRLFQARVIPLGFSLIRGGTNFGKKQDILGGNSIPR